MATPKAATKTIAGAVETKSRLEQCWKVDVNWKLYPRVIQEVEICAEIACLHVPV